MGSQCSSEEREGCLHVLVAWFQNLNEVGMASTQRNILEYMLEPKHRDHRVHEPKHDSLARGVKVQAR